MENAEKLNEEKQDENLKRDSNFIYFIDTHEKTKKFKIYLPNEYEGANSLELIKEIETEKELNKLISKVYRFKIVPGSLKKEERQEYEQ